MKIHPMGNQQGDYDLKKTDDVSQRKIVEYHVDLCARYAAIDDLHVCGLYIIVLALRGSIKDDMNVDIFHMCGLEELEWMKY